MATQRVPPGRKPTTGRKPAPSGRAERPPPPPPKNNLPLILGGAGGGLLLLILLIVMLSSGGGKPDRTPVADSKAPKVEAPKKPVIDVSVLETLGKKKIEDGLKVVQPRLKPDPAAPKENVRGDLEKGIKLLDEGIAAYEEAARRAGKSYPIADAQRTRSKAVKTLCDDDLEKDALTCCEKGLKMVQATSDVMTGKTAMTDDDKKKLGEDLRNALNLLTEGMSLFSRSNQVSGHTFDTNKYGQAMKLARIKILELK